MKTGEYELEALDWGVRLTTAKPVRGDVSHVGIRAHYFSPTCRQNSYPVRLTGSIEEPFEDIICFRYVNQLPDTPDLWWRIPKQFRPQGVTQDYVLGTAGANVLALYPPENN